LNLSVQEGKIRCSEIDLCSLIEIIVSLEDLNLWGDGAVSTDICL